MTRMNRIGKEIAMGKLICTGIERFCVLYLKQPLSVVQKEFRSPWFYSRERAERARDLLALKYGRRNVVIYND